MTGEPVEPPTVAVEIIQLDVDEDPGEDGDDTNTENQRP